MRQGQTAVLTAVEVVPQRPDDPGAPGGTDFRAEQGQGLLGRRTLQAGVVGGGRGELRSRETGGGFSGRESVI